MNFAETARRLLKRWYILLAGVLLAVGAAFGVWGRVPPTYVRSASQVLLPGSASLPDRAKNPYLYLGGLTLAADVVVRAVGSESLVQELERDYPGTQAEVSRDPSTAGPVVVIVVTSPSDADAAAVLDMLVARTATALDELQRAEAIPLSERISVVPVTIDEQSTIRDRNRIIFSAATVVAILLVTLILAAVVEGLSGRRKPRHQAVDAGDGSDGPAAAHHKEEPPRAATAALADPNPADVAGDALPGDDPLPSAERGRAADTTAPTERVAVPATVGSGVDAPTDDPAAPTRRRRRSTTSLRRPNPMRTLPRQRSTAAKASPAPHE